MSHTHSPVPIAFAGIISERMGQSWAVGRDVRSAVMAEVSAPKARYHSLARVTWEDY